jgi:hypothetical protein
MQPPATTTIRPTPIPAPTKRVSRPLSAQECWAQLRDHREGRLGYLSGRGPRHVVLPYSVRDHELLVRVPAYNEAGQYAVGRRVTFDVIAPLDAATAGRVEVTGHARLVDGVAEGLDAPGDEAWPSDLPSRLVGLRVDGVHGTTEELVGRR